MKYGEDYIDKALNEASGLENIRIITDKEESFEQLKEERLESSDCSFGKDSLHLYKDELVKIKCALRFKRKDFRALSRKVLLKSGACICIDETEAMVVIDCQRW